MKLIPNKAQFDLNETISFTIQDCQADKVNIEIINVKGLVYQEDVPIVNDTILIENYNFKSGGYLARIENESHEKAETAFDVATGMIRYGFLSDFFDDVAENKQSIQWLNRLHLNYVQYYDWMYRHDDLVPKSEIFDDLLGRQLSKRTIQKRIEQASRYGIKNIAYGAIYGATNDFANSHPEWRLYDKSQNAIGFFDFLSIMNVNRESGWYNHIIHNYQETIAFGFDGIHMDTYGFPKEAYNYSGKMLNLPEDFGQLIDDTKATLKKVNDDVKLIFNNVGNWPVSSVANRNQDALYIEVWDPYSTYKGIEEIIKNAQRENAEKQVILAAYLKPFEDKVTEQTYNALFLLTAIITTMGATHLIHGENAGLITEGYYANYYQMQSEIYKDKVIVYYDYITYLADFWRDNSLVDVSKTHLSGDNREYVANGDLLSPNFEAGKLYVNIRQNETFKFINFINLTKAKDVVWNQSKDISMAPSFQFKILLSADVKQVTYLTPDDKLIQMAELKTTYETNEFGTYLILAIPEILVWGTVIVEMFETENV